MSTILCIGIGDDPGLCAVLERQLTELGHEPRLVTSLDASLGVLARERIDLVIFDEPKPGASEPDLSAMLRERGLELPVILMTPHSNVANGAGRRRHGAIGQVSTPLRAETLRLAVEHGLEVSRLRRENEEYRREVDALRAECFDLHLRPDGRRRPHAPNREIAPPPAPQTARAAGGPTSDAQAPINLRELERLAIQRALAATGGHRTRAAGLLGISERTLRNKLNGPSAVGR